MGCIPPTMHCRSQHCWESLHPFAHHCQHARNNSQHCWRNNVGSCCVRLRTALDTMYGRLTCATFFNTFLTIFFTCYNNVSSFFQNICRPGALTFTLMCSIIKKMEGSKKVEINYSIITLRLIVVLTDRIESFISASLVISWLLVVLISFSSASNPLSAYKVKRNMIKSNWTV